MVLPESLLVPLGFASGDLEPVRMQTANGETHGALGMLAEVSVQGSAASDVAVAFVPDAQLGGKALLGMSYLGRFRVTLDPNGSTLTLESK